MLSIHSAQVSIPALVEAAELRLPEGCPLVSYVKRVPVLRLRIPLLPLCHSQPNPLQPHVTQVPPCIQTNPLWKTLTLAKGLRNYQVKTSNLLCNFQNKFDPSYMWGLKVTTGTAR